MMKDMNQSLQDIDFSPKQCPRSMQRNTYRKDNSSKISHKNFLFIYLTTKLNTVYALVMSNIFGKN